MKKINLLLLFVALTTIGMAQKTNNSQFATLVETAESMIEIPSIASQIADGTIIPSQDINKEVNMKKQGANKAVPGKGLPLGNDPLWANQTKVKTFEGKDPILTFEAASANVTPTDPTAAVGPNHFINAWNSSFRIWDKSGNPLMNAAALGTILQGNMGDPIVFYDQWADRFIITEFYNNGFGMAICQGSDPLNDGWYLYTFNTSSFPDYPKFSLWSDGYYITANKDSGSAGSSEVVFAVDRDKMIAGDPNAQMIGFPLTGITTSGFYSPLGFNALGSTPPPAGDAPIVYMQDDSWSGVSTDHIKIWNINVDWTSPGSSTISSPQEINTTPFDGLFDGGSFSNLSQPSGPDLDALQATIMYMANYRRFSSYNSAIFNFVVDLDGSDDLAGIRWYELRQNNDGDPWTIYQEGTYAQPDGHSAFSGAMCMDASGNIALSYTIVSSTQVPALRFTGRNPGDPLGTMTLAEETIVDGTASDPSNRYGDYSQMTIDPSDDATFWTIGEYFAGGTRKNHVGVFQMAPPTLAANFTADETIICLDGEVHFSDASIANPTSWEWSFPGGLPNSFTGQNPPVVTYAYPGSYDVSLTVSDGTDTHTETKADFITVKDLIAGFTSDVTSVIVGSPVNFSDDSNCGPTTWEWSFPGGTPSSYTGENPPAIYYNAEGSYDVSISVTNGVGGMDTETIEDYITVMPPVFNMENTTVTTCMGTFFDSGGASGDYENNEDLTMTFLPASTGAMISVEFTDFDVEDNSSCNYDKLSIYDGDDANGTLLGEFCGTSLPGTFTATNTAGALTFVFTSDYSVTKSGWEANVTCEGGTELPPIANFSASTTTPVVNDEVTLNDLSSNNPTSWNWEITPSTFAFVNGTSQTSQNPELTFTNTGAYTVSLTATNSFGSDTETKANYFDVLVGINEYEETNDLVIASLNNNKFSVHYKASHTNEPLLIEVHNMMGHTLISNRVHGNNGEYNYNFDMSYAAPGIYFIYLGSKNFKKVKRILVK